MGFNEGNLFKIFFYLIIINLKPTPCGNLDVKKSNPKDKDDFNHSSDEGGKKAQPE